MKRDAAERSRSGPRQPRSVGPTRARKIESMLGAAAAGLFGQLQFVEPLAVGGDATADEQFGDQLVLGAEMIVHRREIDIGSRHDVAQRDIETSLGVKPLGRIEDRGPGLVGRHVMGLCASRVCNSNSCMKLSFDGGECQCATSRETSPACRPSAAPAKPRGKNGLADQRPRRDSAGNEFQE